MPQESLEQKHAVVAALLNEETIFVYQQIVAARFPHLATARNSAALIDDYLRELRSQFPDTWGERIKQMDKESKNPLLPSNRK